MADFYREYKPFRNFLRQFGLQESLIDVWRYSLLVMDKIPLPPSYIQGIPLNIDPRSVLYAWELDILSREPYVVRGQTFHGADWILSDQTGHVFIEAKTKRLTVNARVSSDMAALEKDLKVLAAAVAQHYRNIQDAVDGKTEWANDGLPIYPLIVTLEDWYIFSPRVHPVEDPLSNLKGFRGFSCAGASNIWRSRQFDSH
jgi:hypothetical protein